MNNPEQSGDGTENFVVWERQVDPPPRANPDEAPMIQVSIDGYIVTVTVGSGQRRNALPSSEWAALRDLIVTIGARQDAAAILIRGTGNTFCAGSDIREWLGAPEDLVEMSFTHMEAAFRAIEECPIPVVAQIAGVAAGAGCQLALACDMRIMSDTARIGMPIARLGINASPAFAARMTRVAGPAASARLLYTGRLLTAADAVRIGLADESAADDDVDMLTQALLGEIARQPSEAIRSAKAAIRSATGQLPPDALGPAAHYPALQHGIGQVLNRHS